jgi:hypothetical protein
MRAIGDLVAIYIDNKPSVYARIESIEPDLKRHWYQVRLLFLGFPLQETTWILKEEYLEGSSFTMKDIPVQIIPVEKPGSYRVKDQKRMVEKKADVISIDRIRAKKEKKDHVPQEDK